MSSHINSFSSPPVPHHPCHLNCCEQYINKASKKQSYMNRTAQNVFLPIPHISVFTWLTPTLANQTRNEAKWGIQHHGLVFCACARRRPKSICLLPSEAGSIKTVLLYMCLCVELLHTGKDTWNYKRRKMQRQDLSLQVKHSKEGWLLNVRQEARRKWFFHPSMTSWDFINQLTQMVRLMWGFHSCLCNNC